MKTSLDLINLAGLGTALIVDAKNLSTLDLINIVGIIGLKESHITIRNADLKTTLDLMQISSIYPKNITLDLTDSID